MESGGKTVVQAAKAAAVKATDKIRPYIIPPIRPVWLRQWSEGIYFSKYPKHYNPYVHGPYCPSRNYHPNATDKPFKDVKVGELSQWIRRRNIGVFGTISMVTRGYNRFKLNYVQTRRFTGMGFIFLILGTWFVLGYVNYMPNIRAHRHSKYH